MLDFGLKSRNHSSAQTRFVSSEEKTKKSMQKQKAVKYIEAM